MCRVGLSSSAAEERTGGWIVMDTAALTTASWNQGSCTGAKEPPAVSSRVGTWGRITKPAARMMLTSAVIVSSVGVGAVVVSQGSRLVAACGRRTQR